MHELSIAVSLLELLEEEVERRGPVQVVAVHLKLGDFSGVVKEALVSSFEMAAESTQFHGAALVIEEVPVVIDCPRCEAPRPVHSVQMLCCAECGTPSAKIVQGKELEVTALEIEECAQNPA